MTITISTSNDLTPRAIEFWSDTVYPTTALEEALYIWWELTPTSRDWRRKLHEDGCCLFDYHNAEFFLVTQIGDTSYYIEMN